MEDEMSDATENVLIGKHLFSGLDTFKIRNDILYIL